MSSCCPVSVFIFVIWLNVSAHYLWCVLSCYACLFPCWYCWPFSVFFFSTSPSFSDIQWSAGSAPRWVNSSLAELATASRGYSFFCFVCVCVCVCISLKIRGSAYHISLCLADSALIIAPWQGSSCCTEHTNTPSSTHTNNHCWYWSCSIDRQAQPNTTLQIHNIQMSCSSGCASEGLLLSSDSNECLVCTHTPTPNLLSKLLWRELKEACRDRPASLISPSVSWALRPARFSSMVLVQQVGPWGHILRCSP